MLNLSEETEQLARLVAVKNGTTPEDVVRAAVEDQARAVGVLSHRQDAATRNSGSPANNAGNRRSKAELVTGMEAISQRSAARPLLDSRLIDEIIDYDEIGLPR